MSSINTLSFIFNNLAIGDKKVSIIWLNGQFQENKCTQKLISFPGCLPSRHAGWCCDETDAVDKHSAAPKSTLLLTLKAGFNKLNKTKNQLSSLFYTLAVNSSIGNWLQSSCLIIGILSTSKVTVVCLGLGAGQWH